MTSKWNEAPVFGLSERDMGKQIKQSRLYKIQI